MKIAINDKPAQPAIPQLLITEMAENSQNLAKVSPKKSNAKVVQR